MNRRDLLAAVGLGTLSVSTFSGLAPAHAAAADKLVFGDSYTRGVGASVRRTYGWAYRVAAALGSTKVDGNWGSGYVNPTRYGAGSYVDRLWRYEVDPGIRLVVIQGSSNDAHDASGAPYTGAAIGTGINQAWRLLTRRFPNARVIVLGICNPYGPGQDLIHLNSRLQTYSRAFGFQFVNPITWFKDGDGKTYANQANGHPNDAGHRLIAKKFLRMSGVTKIGSGSALTG